MSAILIIIVDIGTAIGRKRMAIKQMYSYRVSQKVDGIK